LKWELGRLEDLRKRKSRNLFGEGAEYKVERRGAGVEVCLFGETDEAYGKFATKEEGAASDVVDGCGEK
jgi:hypothetical protein